jgi:ssDNA-binding Zn-finger/Zn-ribbon topoisomerase 1
MAVLGFKLGHDKGRQDMPLIKCPTCGKEISAQAASCPNCGHPLAKSAAKKFPNNKRLGVIIIFLVIIGAIASVNSGNQTAKTTTQEDLCRSDWTKCADNEQLVNRYSDWSHVKVECKQAANDRAKYGNPDWPWLPFGSFYKGNNYITSGVVVAVEPDAQFSNGFGGMVHSRVTCTYDLRAKRVTNVDVSSR